jgi:hypothetical protein
MGEHQVTLLIQLSSLPVVMDQLEPEKVATTVSHPKYSDTNFHQH